jgi:hypothetical protein
MMMSDGDDYDGGGRMIRNPTVAHYVSRMQTPIAPCPVTRELYGNTRWVLVESEVRREIRSKFFWVSQSDLDGAVAEHRERVTSSRYVAGARSVQQ